MSQISLLSTLSFALLCLALFVDAYHLRRPIPWAFLLNAAAYSLLLFWVPYPLNGQLLPALVLLSSLQTGGSLLWGVVFSGVFFGIALYWSGLSTALLVLFSLAMTALRAMFAQKHLQRVKGARQVQPGQVAPEESSFSGSIEGIRPTYSPLPDLSCAAWWFQYKGVKRSSKAPVRIRRDALTALLETGGIEPSMRKNIKVLKEEEIKKVFAENQWQDQEVTPNEKAYFYWLEEQQEACVIGTPTMETRPEIEHQYREGALTPVFRNKPEQGLYLCDQSAGELAKEARWARDLYVAGSLIVLVQLFYLSVTA